MAFKTNIRDPFLPATDTFGGRGKAKGLNHGGQYDVTYIVENLNKGGRKAPARPAQAQAQPAVKRQAPKRGEKPFLRSSPPVASPTPTAQEKSKMKKVVGVDDVSVDNENFVNLTGSTKDKIREGLAKRSCVTGTDGDNCNGYHAIWQASIGNCNASVIGKAKQVLDKCSRAQGGDVSWCTSGLVQYSGVSKKNRRLYVQEVAKKFLGDLNNEIEACKAGRQFGEDGTETGGGTTYGCMDSKALNFNPNANFPDNSCQYPDEGDDTTTGGGTGDGVQEQLNTLFDAITELASTQNRQRGEQAPTGGPTMGGMQYDPYAYDPTIQQPATAGLGGGINPLVIGGIVLVAGLAIFLMNQPKQPVMGTAPAPRPQVK